MAPAGPYSDSLMDAPNDTAPRSGCNSFFKVGPNITRVFDPSLKGFFWLAEAQRRSLKSLRDFLEALL